MKYKLILLVVTVFICVALIAGCDLLPKKTEAPAPVFTNESAEPTADSAARPEYSNVRFYYTTDDDSVVRFTIGLRGEFIDLEAVSGVGSDYSGFTLYGDESFDADYDALLAPIIDELYSESKDSSDIPVPSANIYFSKSLYGGSYNKVAEIDKDTLHKLAFVCLFHKNAFYTFMGELDGQPSVDVIIGEPRCAEILYRHENGLYYRYSTYLSETSVSCAVYEEGDYYEPNGKARTFIFEPGNNAPVVSVLSCVSAIANEDKTSLYEGSLYSQAKLTRGEAVVCIKDSEHNSCMFVPSAEQLDRIFSELAICSEVLPMPD